MEKEFIPYEQALALKELGFDEPCLGYYVGKDREVYISNETISAPFQFRLESKTTFVAPLYQQAFRWFREKYNLDSWITKENKYQQPYCWYIQDNITEYNSDFRIGGLIWDTFFQTYEEAELECLVKLIEIVKKQNLKN
jgi:hypothetical protein